MFGRIARMPIDLVYGTNTSSCQNVHCFVRDTAAVLEKAYQCVRSTVGLQQEHQKELYDRRELATQGPLSSGRLFVAPFISCSTWLLTKAPSLLDGAL